MSDFRFAGRWLNDRRVMTLGGDEFKAFVTAGTWMVENRTDGIVMPDDLEFIPRFDRACIPRLIIAGLWEEHRDGWRMIDYQASQTSKAEFEVLEKARASDRNKKTRQRYHRIGDHSLCTPGTCDQSPGLSRGNVPGTTQARQGQARQGQDNRGTSGSWPTAVPGDPESWGDPSAPGAVTLKAVV